MMRLAFLALTLCTGCGDLLSPSFSAVQQVTVRQTAPPFDGDGTDTGCTPAILSAAAVGTGMVAISVDGDAAAYRLLDGDTDMGPIFPAVQVILTLPAGVYDFHALDGACDSNHLAVTVP